MRKTTNQGPLYSATLIVTFTDIDLRMRIASKSVAIYREMLNSGQTLIISLQKL